MTDASQLPKLPWWVRWWTDTETTRTSFRQDAWIDFLVAAGFLVVLALIGLYWNVGFRLVLLPSAFALAGIWKLLAIAWIDRHQAWDHVGGQKAAPNGSTDKPATLRRKTLIIGGCLAGLLLLILFIWGNQTSPRLESIRPHLNAGADPGPALTPTPRPRAARRARRRSDAAARCRPARRRRAPPPPRAARPCHRNRSRALPIPAARRPGR
jgi:hypothetical protein